MRTPPKSVKTIPRRDKIVQSAVGTLSRHGFRGATTRRIARDAGVSEALLYKHFGSKDELFDAVLEHLLKTFRPPCALSDNQETGTDREFLLAYATQLLAKAKSSPEEVRILFYAGLQGHRLATDYYKRQVNPILQALVSRLETGQNQGRYRPVPAEAAANGFLSMIRFQVLKLVIFNQSPSRKRDADWPELFVDIFLRGIAQ